MNLLNKIYLQINDFNLDKSEVYAKHIQNRLINGLEQYNKILEQATQKIINQDTEKILKQL